MYSMKKTDLPPSIVKFMKNVVVKDTVEIKEGYDVQFIENYNEKYICLFCKKLMRDPIQTGRGELACRSCYFINAQNSPGVCPIDHDPIDITTQIFPDNRHRLEILRLMCRCKYNSNGCSWEGDIQNLEEHQLKCNFQPVVCPLCNKPASGKLYEHLKSCPQVIESNVCLVEGCDFKPHYPEDLINHMEQEAFAHSALLVNFMEKLSVENIALQEKVTKQQLEAKEMETNFQNKIKFAENQLVNLAKALNEVRKELAETKNEVAQCKELATAIPSLDTTKNESTIASDLAVLNVSVSELDLKQQLMDNTSYDGTLLWKIDNYRERLQQAIIGTVTALHSAPCFTERYGYKFCARLYLNGDGMGKGTHISLFFVLMKSEYDNLKHWPFKDRVTFKLRNQSGSRKEHKESFIPDRNSSSFQKPIKQMNVAAGCPMFISKVDLDSGGYIKDNCLFLEVSVERS